MSDITGRTVPQVAVANGKTNGKTLVCPKCSATDIRKPYGWRTTAISLGALVLFRAAWTIFESQVRSNSNLQDSLINLFTSRSQAYFFLDKLPDWITAIIFTAVLCTFFIALTGDNRHQCRMCNHRWQRHAKGHRAAAGKKVCLVKRDAMSDPILEVNPPTCPLCKEHLPITGGLLEKYTSPCPRCGVWYNGMGDFNTFDKKTADMLKMRGYIVSTNEECSAQTGFKDVTRYHINHDWYRYRGKS